MKKTVEAYKSAWAAYAISQVVEVDPKRERAAFLAGFKAALHHLRKETRAVAVAASALESQVTAKLHSLRTHTQALVDAIPDDDGIWR